MGPSPTGEPSRSGTARPVNHNQMMDEKGRVWFDGARPSAGEPGLLQGGLGSSVGESIPAERASRHLSMYDPASGKFTLISTCFPTHHLIFAEDANNTLWTSPAASAGPAACRLAQPQDVRGDRRRKKSQGWTPFVLDTNGNGKRDEYVEPDKPVDPTKDKRVVVSLLHGRRESGRWSIWGRRWDIPVHRPRRAGSGPDAHRAHRDLRAAVPGLRAARRRHRPQRRVLGVARERPSRQFDRRKCKVLNGPTATGKHCPEGWTLHRVARAAVQGRAGRRAAPRRATTPGSTGSTRSGWAGTCRSPRAT